jgi:hypothetical protein
MSILEGEYLEDFISTVGSVVEYPKAIGGKLIHATVADVTDLTKNIYIVNRGMYFPLKFNKVNELNKDIYYYDLYNADFTIKSSKQLYTSKDLIESRTIFTTSVYVYESNPIPAPASVPVSVPAPVPVPVPAPVPVSTMKLTDFILEINRDSELFKEYPKPTTGRLIPATIDDVTNPEKKLYILDKNMHAESTDIYIPLKFKFADTNVNFYDLYKPDFTTKVNKEIQTRKITIADKIARELVFVYDSTPVTASFIFDFDCTLTVRHLFYFLNNLAEFKKLYSTELTSISISEDVINNIYIFARYHLKLDDTSSTINEVEGKELFIKIIFGSQERIEILKNMFTDIGTDNLYIASRGIKDQIIKTLDFVGLGGLIKSENITGGGTEKTKILNDHIVKENVFYVDDDNTEHLDFVRVLGTNLRLTRENTSINTYTHIPTNTTYKFYKNLVKNTGGGIKNEILTRLATDIFPILTQSGGGKDYYKLYLKYKSKYINLKK